MDDELARLDDLFSLIRWNEIFYVFYFIFEEFVLLTGLVVYEFAE